MIGRSRKVGCKRVLAVGTSKQHNRDLLLYTLFKFFWKAIQPYIFQYVVAGDFLLTDASTFICCVWPILTATALWTRPPNTSAYDATNAPYLKSTNANGVEGYLLKDRSFGAIKQEILKLNGVDSNVSRPRHPAPTSTRCTGRDDTLPYPRMLQTNMKDTHGGLEAWDICHCIFSSVLVWDCVL